MQMQTLEDWELLREYSTNRSESAFNILVQRYINLVYSAAIRRVREPELAKEVTQTVFIILARKASTLSSRTILSGWLYRTAQFAGAKAVRTEVRRERLQNIVAQMYQQETDSAWDHVAPLLEDGMAALTDADRNAIVLRYFENKSLKAVGSALGLNEDTAQKRVSRAVERLRSHFAKRGVVLPGTLLIATLSANAVQAAPASVFAATSSASLKRPTQRYSKELLILWHGPKQKLQ
jgi:RNA polymerase sigma factor (sigma-70 family)